MWLVGGFLQDLETVLGGAPGGIVGVGVVETDFDSGAAGVDGRPTAPRGLLT